MDKLFTFPIAGIDGLRDLPLVRAAFIAKGTSFAGWCRENGIDPSYARKIILGFHRGEAAMETRALILDACGVENSVKA